MPSHLKGRVRTRMEKTGEGYQQAHRQVRAQIPEPEGATGVVDEARRARSRIIADTAFSIAVVRSEESERPANERLFADPYASVFAGQGAHAFESTQRFLDLPFFRDGVRLRTRFIDDIVREGLTAGLDQVVLLGAGFDARGLRMSEIGARRATVYEVDTAEQLTRKRKMLAAARIHVPSRVNHVPVDFDGADFDTEISAALAAKGFRRGGGAIFVWEGVIGFIDRETIDRSLRLMASVGGPGSLLAFTFGVGIFEPDTASEVTRRAGFSACEESAGDELWRRYLPGEPHPNAFVMKVGKAVV